MIDGSRFEMIHLIGFGMISFFRVSLSQIRCLFKANSLFSLGVIDDGVHDESDLLLSTVEHTTRSNDLSRMIIANDTNVTEPQNGSYCISKNR